MQNLKLFVKACNSRLKNETIVDIDGTEYVEIGFDIATVKDELSTSPKLQLRSVFDTWLSKVIAMISSRCKVALGVMQSAFEVAKLQQRMGKLAAQFFRRVVTTTTTTTAAAVMMMVIMVVMMVMGILRTLRKIKLQHVKFS